MSRPTDWSPLQLSSDPVPGDPGMVLAYGNKYADVADAINRTAAKLHAIADHGDSESSEYVDELRGSAKEVADDIQKAHERYAGVAQAMKTYSTPLERAQSLADAALAKARGASDQLGHTTAMHHHYETLLQDPSTSDADRTHYTQLQQQNTQALSDAHGTLASAQSDLQHAIDMRNTAAKAASDSIKKVESSGGINDSGWTKFWEHNGGWIDEVIKWVSIAAGVLAVVAMFVPGLNVIVAIVGLVVAAVVIANAIMQMTAGTKSLTAGITDIVLALIPFGVGKLLGHFAAAAEPAIEDAAAVTVRTSSAAQGIKGITQAKAAEDVAGQLADVKPKLIFSILNGPADATALAKMNYLAEKATLTVAGPSTRIAGLVEGATSPSEAFEGLHAVWDASGTPDAIGGWVEEHTEPHEMAGAESGR